MVSEKHGESAEGTHHTSGPMKSLGWSDVLNLSPLPRKFALEVFAGTARII